MPLLAKVVTFLSKASTGAQQIPGIGFEPKFIHFMLFGSTALSSFEAEFYGSLGHACRNPAAALKNYCIAGSANGGAATSETARRQSNTLCYLKMEPNAGTILASASLTATDGDSFTLTYGVVDGVQHEITALVLGGSSLTHVDILEFTEPGATGNQGLTGLGFQPDNLLSALGASAAFDTDPSPGTITLAFGASDGTNSWLIGFRDTDAQATMLTGRGHRTGQVTGTMNSTNVWDKLASLVSLDADGLTLNWSARSGSSKGYFVCFKGISMKVGTLAQVTSAAPVDQSITGGSFRPAAVITAAPLAGTLTGNGSTNAAIDMGFAAIDGSCGAQAVRDENGTANAEIEVIARDNLAWEKIATTTAGTILAEATIEMKPDGHTWHYSVNDASGSNISYIEFGPAAERSQSQVIMVA